MASKSYHVIPAPSGGWSVKKEGAHRATKTFETKEMAVKWARSYSRDNNLKLYIHDRDGRVADRYIYGHDTALTKDWQSDIRILPGKKVYETNVFVNCPFDEDYEPLKKALLYSILSLGCNPRIAAERADSGEQRVTKICDLIRESAFSIHDLSRLKSAEKGEYYRLNMPFELGIDFGSREFAPTKFEGKRFLILATRRYEYMKALSDLNGVDIQAHSDDPQTLIRRVRNWVVTVTGRTDYPAPAALWYDYGDFNADLYDKLKALNFSDEDIDELPIVEYIDYANRWLSSKAS